MTTAMHTPQGSFVDMDQSRGLTDFSTPANIAPFTKANPFALLHFDHFKRVAASFNLQRRGFIEADREHQEQYQHLGTQFTVASKEPTLFRWEKDPKGEDKKVYLPRREIAIQARMVEINKEREGERARVKKLPEDLTPFLIERMTRLGAAQMVEVPMAEHDSGKGFDADNVALRDALKEHKSIQFANISFDEFEANVRAAVAEKAKNGAFDFAAMFASGRFDSQSDFRLGPPSPFVVPTQYVLVDGADAGASVSVPDDFAIRCALDPDGTINKILELGREYAKNKRSIPMSARPAMLREQAEKILLARRHLEFSCRALESQGRAVRRPENTPIEILLWMIAAPKPKPVLKVIPPDAAMFEGGDDE